MKISIIEKKAVEVKYLKAYAAVRYWEDTTVDGVQDTDGSRIPCRDGDEWCPLIELESGTILNWKKGTEADIHYKVADEAFYHLLDEEQQVVREIEGYVPKIMCPGGDGYGDYIIMKVDIDGQIENWRPTLKEFEDNDDE